MRRIPFTALPSCFEVSSILQGIMDVCACICMFCCVYPVGNVLHNYLIITKILMRVHAHNVRPTFV